MSGGLRVSPRTDAAPMAFTAREFLRGAISAWGWFIVFSTVAHIPLAGYYFWLVLFFIVPWSLGALLVGSPLAYGLGWGMRGIPSVPVHAAMFALFGAVVAITTTALAVLLPGLSLGGLSVANYAFSITAVCVASAVAVPLGWWQSARRALRRDREELRAGTPGGPEPIPFRTERPGPSEGVAPHDSDGTRGSSGP